MVAADPSIGFGSSPAPSSSSRPHHQLSLRSTARPAEPGTSGSVFLLQEFPSKGVMDHFATRLAPGGGHQLPLSSRVEDRRSRFWHMDSPQPLPVICPQPRRASRPASLFEPSLSRASSPKPNGALPVYRADSASDVLDFILSKNDTDNDSSRQATFFCGSPPVRTNNPVVHDPMFGEKTPSFSPLGSSFGKKLAGRLEVGSPSCGASSPKVRIEGFACGNKESHCAVA